MELSGIDAIASYVGRSIPTLITWRVKFGFPIIRNESDGVLSSSVEAIETWRRARKVNLKTATDHDLERWELAKLRASGKAPKLKRRLTGIKEIAAFVERSESTVFGWARDFEGCPIRQDKKTGIFCSDADALRDWMEASKLDKASLQPKRRMNEVNL